MRKTLSLLALVCACGGAQEASAPPHLDLPVPPVRGAAGSGPTGPSREAPPSSLASKPSPFPAIARSSLDNGVRVAVVSAHALPIVQIRVMIGAGMGYGTPGAAQLTGEMLKEGGTRSMTSAQVLSRIESLGASLSVDVDFDRTTLGLGVTKSHLDEALALLAQVTMEPRFDGTELRKLKARRTDEAREAARGSGSYSATRLLFKELYAPTNPYSSYDLVPSEIAKVSEQTLRDFHKRFYVPKNIEVIITGDVDAAQAQASVKKTMDAFKGGPVPKVEFPEAIAPAKRRVILASRPQSEQSDIFIVSFAPPRSSADWPDLRVANQILGGGVASRLFGDVREQRSLAYSTGSQIIELAHGKEPLLAFAGTATKKTALAIQGILENFDRISKSGVEASEIATAGRFLSDIFAIRLENIGSIANMVATQDSFGLPDGYWDTYRAAVRGEDAARVNPAAQKLFGTTAQLIIVAGDASAIGKPLSHFGEVVVVDPEKEFATVQTIPMNETAPLE